VVRVSPFSGPGKEICPPDHQESTDRSQNNDDNGISTLQKSPGYFTFAGENFYASRTNWERGRHAMGAVGDAQLASYYLAGYRDASRYFATMRSP
jgi:hypothetical protein